MINGAKAEFKNELIEHMTLEAKLEFGEEVSKWLNRYYEHINDQVSLCCRGFRVSLINNDLHQATLFVCLLVKGDVQKISGVTFMVLRCPNIYNALKTKALRKTETCYSYQIDER